GYVVRSESLTSLYGRYLYGDFCVGELRSFVAEPGRRAEDDRPLGVTVPQLSSFGGGHRGRGSGGALAGRGGALARAVAGTLALAPPRVEGRPGASMESGIKPTRTDAAAQPAGDGA